ncbi:MAG: hypothetical protein HYW28_12920 [Rhodospirillales bacterium]|nr:hypothetical protein [Rhodospirillales bacterium]
MAMISYRQALIVMLALALITTLYFMSRVADPDQYRAVIDYLREIRRMEVIVNQDTLKARSALLPHYDSFVANTARVSTALRDIRETSARIYGTDTNDMTRALNAFGEQNARRLTALEDFKSDNAVLRNSLGYFPIAAAEISLKIKQTSDAALADEVDRLHLDLLDYYLTGGSDLRQNVVSRIQRLIEATRPGPQDDPAWHTFNQQASDVRQLLAHANVVLDYRDRVNAEVENVLARSSTKAVDNLMKIIDEHYAKILKDTDKFRFMLYAVAIALLCYIAFLLMQVQRGALALHQAKEEADRANRSKTHFLANMSHELRTPLNAIIGFATVMVNEMFGPIGHKRYKEYATDIHASGNQLVALIGDILDISKVEVGKLDVFDTIVSVRDVVTDTARLMDERARQAHIDLSVTVPNDLPLLRADQVRVKQIILNLLDNGLKFTRPHGAVRIEGYLEARGGISIKVADTGIGIAEQDMNKVLEAFGQANHSYTHTYRGAGLGLALSKSLMELHGGTLHLESELGKGTTVIVRFPADRTIIAPRNPQT